LKMRSVDRRGKVDRRSIISPRGVVRNPSTGRCPRMASVVVGVEAGALPFVAQGQLADGLRQVQPLGAQRVGDVERRELAGQRRKRNIKVDSEELARRGAVDDELLLVGGGEEAVELLWLVERGRERGREFGERERKREGVRKKGGRSGLKRQGRA
jgi:hypothetical protein